MMTEATQKKQQDSEFKTRGGLNVTLSEVPAHGLESIYAEIDHKKGAVFSSGFDYPGRHSRWDIGFVDPALEFLARGRKIELRSLNDQGRALLPLIATSLEQLEEFESFSQLDGEAHGLLKPPPKFFPEEQRSRQASMFSVLRALIDLFGSDAPEAAMFGLYGAFGYDLVTQFEELALRLERSGNQPDCHLYLPLDLIVIDRKRELSARYSYSIETPEGPTASLKGGGASYESPGGKGSLEIESDHTSGEFAKKVADVIEGTKRGDYFEVVLSQSFSTRFDDSPTKLFKRLAKINPSPYMFLLNFGEEQLVGASPELFVRVNGRRYETCPIAGTVPRGDTPLEDADQVRELIGSHKDESELTMCTDVDRNDMARVCVPGSVRIIGRRQLEFYSHLIHTVDHLEGTLKVGLDALDAFQTHMWACTVTGAPKPAALQTIENLENSPRGWYSGAIGFLCFDGSINTGITLRTAHLKDGRAHLRAGATLLYGSDPKKEEEETRTKAAAFLAALASQSAEESSPPKQEKRRVPQAQGARRKVLLVDCKDSFVHNLASYLREIGAEVSTFRSGFPLDVLDEVKPDLVLLSPGPGTPEEFGIPSLVGELVSRKLPIFGVCLGHQGIGQHFGAEIAQLPVPEHGKASEVQHRSTPLFEGVPERFEAGRYHSLYLRAESIPDCLEVTAHTIRRDEAGGEEVIPMAIEHKSLPIASVQFHPESLMTLKKLTGHAILKNALEILK